MKLNALKALRVAATLSILAGASGLLIAGTDLVTKTIIEQNRIANIKKNLSKVFPDAGFGDGVKLSGGTFHQRVGGAGDAASAEVFAAKGDFRRAARIGRIRRNREAQRRTVGFPDQCDGGILPDPAQILRGTEGSFEKKMFPVQGREKQKSESCQHCFHERSFAFGEIQ